VAGSPLPSNRAEQLAPELFMRLPLVQPTSLFRRRCWLVFERVLDPFATAAQLRARQRDRPVSAAMRQRALAPAQEAPKQSCRVASFVDGDGVCGQPLGRHEREVGDRHPRDPPTDQ
jgi:hypothetical protein